MAEKMKLAYEFDFVFDGQQVFREMLSALSNPGTVRDIQAQAKKFQGDAKELLALGCTLLDNEEKMYVEKNPRLCAELHSLTLCQESNLEEADYVFLSSELNYGSMEEVLKHVKRGTYADPQQSATIFLSCGSIQGKEEMVLKGPGIKGMCKVKADSYIKRVIALRERLLMEYPLGVDLIFADKAGRIMGIPRTCRLLEDSDI